MVESVRSCNYLGHFRFPVEFFYFTASRRVYCARIYMFQSNLSAGFRKIVSDTFRREIKCAVSYSFAQLLGAFPVSGRIFLLYYFGESILCKYLYVSIESECRSLKDSV